MIGLCDTQACMQDGMWEIDMEIWCQLTFWYERHHDLQHKERFQLIIHLWMQVYSIITTFTWHDMRSLSMFACMNMNMNMTTTGFAWYHHTTRGVHYVTYEMPPFILHSLTNISSINGLCCWYIFSELFPVNPRTILSNARNIPSPNKAPLSLRTSEPMGWNMKQGNMERVVEHVRCRWMGVTPCWHSCPMAWAHVCVTHQNV